MKKVFFGGYRYTRALEMIHAILVAVNADDKDLGKIWSDVIRGDYFKDVYYSMGYPLFALNGKRFENDLVETAGGDSVNKLIKRGGNRESIFQEMNLMG
jgi:hypothetical protein